MRKIQFLMSGVILCSFLAGASLAEPIDLWEDFPDDLGENHFFALALPWNNTGEFSYRQMDDLGDYKWGTLAEQDRNVPFINRGVYPWVEMHPAAPESEGKGTGLEYENAIYTYKFLEPGTFDIAGTFSKGDSGDTYVFVKHNTEFLWDHRFSAADEIGAVANFSLANELFAPEDKLYFGVGCGASQTDFGDTTLLTGRINMVPEPVSAGLFLLGGAALAGARKRRKRRL